MADNIYNEDDRQYLQMMQSNIERMANNSANCKAWLTTIVAGFLAIGCSVTALNGWIVLAIIPIVMFWYLDGYYLSLERALRNREIDFLNKTNSGGADYDAALYNFKPLLKSIVCEEDIQKGFVKTSGQWKTKSVFPFYLSLVAVVVIITFVLNKDAICALLCHTNSLM